MSHDTDKLIRQLSLVAFLMAERRAITARDVKSNVEGYSEMSDEAFARRFYSDRAELLALGVPLQSQRDEFTGEELYTLRSEQYFLPQLELDNDELAALQTALYLLEGKFAYAEPLRLALQNLALGRPGFAEPLGRHGAARRGASTPTTRPRCPAGSRSSRARSRSSARSSSSTGRSRATRSPSARSTRTRSCRTTAAGTSIGQDLDRDDIRTFRVSRIRGEIKFATRRERDFRTPTDFDIEQFRGRPPWQIGDTSARRASRCAATPPGGCSARTATRAASRTACSSPTSRLSPSSPPGCCARTAAPSRSSPRSCAARSRARSAACAKATRAGAPQPARESPKRAVVAEPLERFAGPVAPERFAVLQALLAYLLAACGEEKDAEIPADELLERFPSIPAEELEEHLSLLNLVNFGGGCYTIYTELRDGAVHVDKELWGDTFRMPPRLTPLEARAIRLALEYVGPMIAADAHSPLDKVRKKLEETFGVVRARARRRGARRPKRRT